MKAAREKYWKKRPPGGRGIVIQLDQKIQFMPKDIVRKGPGGEISFDLSLSKSGTNCGWQPTQPVNRLEDLKITDVYNN
jgi:hypothetical protein